MSSSTTEANAGEPLDPLSSAPPKPGEPRWVRERKGRLIEINWARWLSGAKPVDPYLVWADLSRFAGFGGWERESTAYAESDGDWPVLMELSPEVLKHPLPPSRHAKSFIFASLEIPGLYKETGARDGTGDQYLDTRFITARVRPDDIEQMFCDDNVLRFQLGLPRLPPVDPRPPFEDIQQDRDKPRTVIGIIDDGCAFAHPAFCSSTGATRVHFLWDQDGARTGHSAPWRRVDQAGYGAELWHQELARYSELAWRLNDDEHAYRCANYGPVRLDLDRRNNMFAVKGGSRQDLPAGTMSRGAHGTSVMFLAAGVDCDVASGIPLRGQRAVAPHPPLPNTTKRESKDYATQWPIIFVQLPTVATLDTSGGSLGVHVLDGIRYIVHRANCIPPDGRAGSDTTTDLGSMNPATELNRSYFNKIIINISYGAIAGPHDGTSIIEQAMADLVRDSGRKGMVDATWICLAVGNSARARAYARLSLRPGECKSIAWRIPPDNPLQSFLEVWLPELDGQGHLLEQDLVNRVALLITPPGLPARRVVCGTAWACQLDGAEAKEPRVVAGAVFSRRVAQGQRGTMALIAVAATRSGVATDTFCAPHGQWIVEVSNETGTSAAGVNPGREIVVQAWTERNDLVFGTPRSQQSTVEAEDPIPEPTEFTPDARRYLDSAMSGRPNHAMTDSLEPRPTMGSLAGAKSVKTSQTNFFEMSKYQRGQTVVVGGYRLADEEMADYSSGGPQRHFIERSFGTPAPLPDSTQAMYAATDSSPRIRPDVNAPSDVGPSLRGLRTVGTRAGSVSRLSGSSAAAPCAARLIANVQHALTPAAGSTAKTADLSKQFGATQCNVVPSPQQRPTAQPARDDRFRSGTWWVR